MWGVGVALTHMCYKQRYVCIPSPGPQPKEEGMQNRTQHPTICMHPLPQVPAEGGKQVGQAPTPNNMYVSPPPGPSRRRKACRTVANTECYACISTLRPPPKEECAREQKCSAPAAGLLFDVSLLGGHRRRRTKSSIIGVRFYN